MELHSSITLLLGIGILGGIFGAVFFQKLHIPQVIGYIAAGLIIGESGFHIVGKADIEALSSFNLFALGIIGFLVGGELHFETLKKYGKQFSAILIGEGVTAFLLVGVSSAAVVYFVSGNVTASVAAGVVFGAIASATDPASTMEVLWEYRTRGILTTTIVAIVALDDALAMTLYGLGTSVARILAGGSASIGHQLMMTAVELFGAVILGCIAAVFLNYILRKNQQKERTLAFAVGVILLVIGVAAAAKMDVILAAMALGTTISNLAHRRTKELMGLIRSSSMPIYVIFFVLVGARLSIAHMPFWIWMIVIVYVVGRSLGKMAGAYLGALVSKAEPVVKKYTGLGLFPQGGVAIGLSIMASQHLGTVQIIEGYSLGDVIVFAVTATTLIVQIIGPPMVKLAVSLAGETGKNITEEDVVASWKVEQVVTRGVQSVGEHESVSKVLDYFSQGTNVVYPVVDETGMIIGTLTLEGLKEVVADWSMWDWLVAADVMSPVRDTVVAALPLQDALNQLELLNIEQIAVVKSAEEAVPVGILDRRTVRRLVSEEVIRRQQVCPVTATPGKPLSVTAS